MRTVEDITAAIDQLPTDLFKRVHDWVVERAERLWDEQIEQDERAGKLDALAAQALAHHAAGRTKPL
ncbi:MAG: hypothetical protein K2W96_01645 [Gemmataceae bacterium]|nr:hypothetical protein [Gemmataceae bacterium]